MISGASLNDPKPAPVVLDVTEPKLRLGFYPLTQVRVGPTNYGLAAIPNVDINSINKKFSSINRFIIFKIEN
jgi:hypothetical protein